MNDQAFSNFGAELVGGTNAFLAALPGLAALGVGSKARTREMDSAARLESARAANTLNLVVIAAVVLIVGVIIYFIAKKKK